MKPRIGKKIYTDLETKEFLAKTFKCTPQAVWLALTFQRNSEMARRMRVLALKRGGTLVGAKKLEWDTTHEEVERTMTQTLGDRVKIVCDKMSGEVTLYVDGKRHSSCTPGGIPEFMKFQNEVELIASAL